jgi:predicted aspartyl protease
MRSLVNFVLVGLLLFLAVSEYAQRPIVVPFQPAGNLIILQARVNGSKPLDFILDTGASGTVISQNAAKSLGLKAESEGSASTQGGEIEAASIKNARIGIGTAGELRNVTLAAIRLNGLEAGVGRRVDGILGDDVFEKYVVEIDYASKIARLYELRSYKYSGKGNIIPITIDDNTPFVKAKVFPPGGDAVEGKFLINTGSTGAVLFNGPFVNRNRLLERVQNTRAVTFGALIAGGSSGRIGRISRVSFGGIDLAGAVANFSQDSEGDDADANAAGMIGSEVLHRVRLVVDYSRKRIILERNASFSAPFEFDMSGASIAAGGRGFKIFKVRSLIEGSPAAQAGLQTGDVIESIDGRPARSLTLPEIRSMFRLPGRTYTLKVKREQKTLDIAFKTRRIV